MYLNCWVQTKRWTWKSPFIVIFTLWLTIHKFTSGIRTFPLWHPRYFKFNMPKMKFIFPIMFLLLSIGNDYHPFSHAPTCYIPTFLSRSPILQLHCRHRPSSGPATGNDNRKLTPLPGSSFSNLSFIYLLNLPIFQEKMEIWSVTEIKRTLCFAHDLRDSSWTVAE